MSKSTVGNMRRMGIDAGPAEVVLSVLVSNFTFALPDQPIVWNVSGVWYPSGEDERAKPRLPLKVGLYKQ